MPDEEEDQEVRQEEEAPAASTGNSALDAELARLRKQNRDLLKEVKTERQTRRELEFSKLKEKFPALELEDLETIPASKLEAILAKVVPSTPAQETGQRTEAPAAEVAELARFTRQAGGAGAPVPQEKISLADAAKIPWPERRELIAQGRVEGVEVPGVTAGHAH